MPFDESGAWVPTLQPPTAAGLGVAAGGDAAPNLPLNPLEVERSGMLDPNSPNSRPVVLSATEAPPVVPILPGAAAPAAAIPAATSINAPPGAGPSLTAAPGPKGIGGGGGAGLPPGSADLQKLITQGTAEEAAGLGKLSEAQEQGASDVGQAYADREALRQRQAEELAAKQTYVRQRQQSLDAEDAENLRVARETTIPDFWAGREGELTGAAITVGLSGAAAALLGSTQNTALTAIQHNVDGYYGREKDRIDNLYKYAEAKGRLDDNMRAQYAGELTDLMQQHAYTLASAADRIEQVQAESQGRIDKAKTDAMVAQLKTKSAQELQAARGLDLNIYDSKTKRISANADAAKVGLERQRLTADKADKEEDKQLQLGQSTFGKKAEIARNRVDTNADIVRALQDPNISPGELRQKLEQAMAINQGEGKRGVSTASLHFVAPALVSAEGKISDTFDSLISGKSGQEMRQKVARLAQTGLDDAQREYTKQSEDFAAGVKGVGYYQKHPEKVAEHQARFYPTRAAGPAGAADPNAEARAWVQAHPNAPQAAAIRQRLGM